MTMPFTSWGYDPNAHSYYTPEEVIRQVVDVISKGGNMLINISPDELGLVPEYQAERLRILGKWLTRFGEAIYGTHRSCIPPMKGLRFTCKDDELYVIQVENPGKDIWIPGLQLLDDAEVELLGCNHKVRWSRPSQADIETYRLVCKDGPIWTGGPESGLHIHVGEIPTIYWQGESALAFKITGIAT